MFKHGPSVKLELQDQVTKLLGRVAFGFCSRKRKRSTVTAPALPRPGEGFSRQDSVKWLALGINTLGICGRQVKCGAVEVPPSGCYPLAGTSSLGNRVFEILHCMLKELSESGIEIKGGRGAELFADTSQSPRWRSTLIFLWEGRFSQEGFDSSIESFPAFQTDLTAAVSSDVDLGWCSDGIDVEQVFRPLSISGYDAQY